MSYKISLSEAEEKELQKRKKNQSEGKILRRLMCIDMKNKGIRNKDIASYCSVCIDTITDWLSLFEEGAFEALCLLNYEGRRIAKLEPYKKEIEKKEEAGEIVSLGQLRQWLREEHGTETCISNLYYFCKKNLIFPTKKLD